MKMDSSFDAAILFYLNPPDQFHRLPVDSKNTSPGLTPFYKQEVYLNKEDFKHPKFGNTPLISQVI